MREKKREREEEREREREKERKRQKKKRGKQRTMTVGERGGGEIWEEKVKWARLLLEWTL